MAIPAWPNGLPYASAYAGFSVDQIANPVLRTEMNSGVGRQRRTSTARITTMKVSIEMTGAQAAVFDAFHASIGDGAARFTMPVWNGGAGYVFRAVQIDQGKVTKTQLGVDDQAVAFTLRVEALD